MGMMILVSNAQKHKTENVLEIFFQIRVDVVVVGGERMMEGTIMKENNVPLRVSGIGILVLSIVV